MARNRKSESGVRVAPAMTALILLALFVALGVGYDWFKNQISILGDQVKKSEIRLAELQRQNRVRREQLATLCSPVALDARVRQLNLGLGPPALAQVIRMTDGPPVMAAVPGATEMRLARTVTRKSSD